MKQLIFITCIVLNFSSGEIIRMGWSNLKSNFRKMSLVPLLFPFPTSQKVSHYDSTTTSISSTSTPIFHPPTQQQNFAVTQGSQFVRNAVRTVGQSVVRIDCEREITGVMSLFSDKFREGDFVKVSGTGIIVSSDGYIITNAHVVENAAKLTITLSNGRSFKAKVIALDEFTDLAVIKTDVDPSNCKLVKAPLGDSSALQAGDWVIAVGCPVGLDFTVTLGVVSSPKRSASEVGALHMKGNYIQTDAALNSGNSGGPLVNDAGQVVGINTMVRSNTEAIGFAIPINRAVQIFEVLKTGRKPTHAFFGVEVTSITPDNARIHNEDPNAFRLPELHGALVMRVIPGSPADLSGIRRFDIIVEVNNAPISNSDDADVNMDQCRPGLPSKMKVARGEGGKIISLDASPKDLYTMIEEKRRLQQPQGPMMIKPSPK
jgi:S1-C subfamily serine protease